MCHLGLDVEIQSVIALRYRMFLLSHSGEWADNTSNGSLYLDQEKRLSVSFANESRLVESLFRCSDLVYEPCNGDVVS